MTNNKQQLSIEWLQNELERIDKEEYYESIEYINARKKAFQQAKEMEKHRMIEFTNEWFEEYQCGLGNFKNPEKYYEETYGGNK